MENIKKYMRFSPYFVVDPSPLSDLALDKFEEKIEKLSPLMKDILMSPQSSRFIEKTVTSRNLSEIQGQDIARIIRDVIVADIYIGDMPAQISSKLGVDQNAATEIARAIVSQLFAPVIEDIKKLQLQKFGKLPGSSAPQQPRQNFAPQNLGGQARPPQHIPGEELPETGGNIIDLRNQK